MKFKKLGLPLLIAIFLQLSVAVAEVQTCAAVLRSAPQRIHLPEISRLHEKELSNILLNEPLDDMHFLRQGVGMTYTATIKKYNLKVIAKRYRLYDEIVGDWKSEHKKEDWDGQYLQMIRNEKIAWIVSRSLKMDVFPFGVIRTMEGKTWWIQLFVLDSVDPEGVTKMPNPSKIFDRLNEEKWTVRSEMLTYILGDVDASSNGIMVVPELRRYYVDAGGALQIVLPRKTRKTSDIANIYPFFVYGDSLTLNHINKDRDFFRYVVHFDPRKMAREIRPLVADHERLKDIVLRLQKVQDQIQKLDPNL